MTVIYSTFQNASHPNVVRFQRALKALGFKQTGALGVYNETFRDTVKKYQKSRGLNDDGIIGGDTIDKLFEDRDSIEIFSLAIPGKNDPAPVMMLKATMFDIISMLNQNGQPDETVKKVVVSAAAILNHIEGKI